MHLKFSSREKGFAALLGLVILVMILIYALHLWRLSKQIQNESLAEQAVNAAITFGTGQLAGNPRPEPEALKVYVDAVNAVLIEEGSSSDRSHNGGAYFYPADSDQDFVQLGATPSVDTLNAMEAQVNTLTTQTLGFQPSVLCVIAAKRNRKTSDPADPFACKTVAHPYSNEAGPFQADLGPGYAGQTY